MTQDQKKNISLKCPNFPILTSLNIACSFYHDGSYSFIMERLGKDLSSYHRRRNFSVAATLMVGMQVIRRLKFIHSCRILHNDLKPDNLMLGLDHPDTLYLIDFGMATPYKRDGCHVTRQRHRGILGTRRYSSADNILGLKICFFFLY